MRPPIDRLLARVAIDANGCWLWQGYIDKQGYGKISVGTGDTKRVDSVHRVAYEFFIGPIPDGLTLDHECHNRDASCAGGPTCAHRRCCNPWHVTPAPLGRNVLASRRTIPSLNAAKTHCDRGHPFDAANTRVYRRRSGRVDRVCRTCHREREQRRRDHPNGSRGGHLVATHERGVIQ